MGSRSFGPKCLPLSRTLGVSASSNLLSSPIALSFLFESYAGCVLIALRIKGPYLKRLLAFSIWLTVSITLPSDSNWLISAPGVQRGFQEPTRDTGNETSPDTTRRLDTKAPLPPCRHYRAQRP